MTSPQTAAEWLDDVKARRFGLVCRCREGRGSHVAGDVAALEAMLRDAKAEMGKATDALREATAEDGTFARFDFYGWAAIEAKWKQGEYR